MSEVTAVNTVNRKFVMTYLLISLYGVVLTMLLDSSISASLIMLLGGNASQAGSVDSLVNLGAILSAVLSAYMLSRFRLYKHMFLVFSLCSLLSLVGLVVCLLVASPEVVIVSTLLTVFLYYFFTGSLSLPLYELLNQFVDKRSRIVVMSNCLAIGQLCSMLVSLGIAWLLSRPAGEPLLHYRWIFGFAAFVGFLNLITMLRLERVEVKRETAEPLSFSSLYLNQFKEIKGSRSIQLFMAAVILYAFNWSATGLFIGLGYRENAMRMNEILASGIFIRTLFKAISYYLCGQLAKRFGNKAILITIGIIGLGSPITSLFLSVDAFIIVLIATNLMPMAYVYFLNHLFERSDETTFKGRFTFFTLAAVPSTVSIPLLGVLVEHQPAVFGIIMLMIQLAGISLVMKFKTVETDPKVGPPA
ncbi:MFS transporter [Paenibacillus sp. LMG 31456]|uniref:MFS transporter n=1 Tax=Paenibacillus foliorum TaxID=2654974 RepID=A0A972K1W8_9BACL|nr:MFS transporter [Paenibacillus foliorum]NOU96156.1 MFS transporter [Paenibacillus foliorum]